MFKFIKNISIVATGSSLLSIFYHVVIFSLCYIVVSWLFGYFEKIVPWILFIFKMTLTVWFGIVILSFMSKSIDMFDTNFIKLCKNVVDDILMHIKDWGWSLDVALWKNSLNNLTGIEL